MPFLCLLIKSVLISGYRYPLGPDLYLHKSEFYVTVCARLCAASALSEGFIVLVKEHEAKRSRVMQKQKDVSAEHCSNH